MRRSPGGAIESPVAEPAGPLPQAEALFYRSAPGVTPKLTNAALRNAEQTLGVKLPRSYTDLLRQQNGGMLRLTGIVFDAPLPHGLTRGRMFCIEKIAGISQSGARSITRLASLARDRWGVPELLIPLEGDAYWCICLDYRDCGPSGEPAITYYELSKATGGDPISCRVAPSFERMLRSLVFDSNDHLVFAIDDPAVPGWELADRLRSLGCRVARSSTRVKGKPPTRWTWKRYDSAFYVRMSSRLRVEGNGTRDPWHLARPAKHPLLKVHVSAEHQESCARTLILAFGESIELIESPADRPPLKLGRGQNIA